MKKVLNIVPYPFLPYYSGGQKLIAQFNHHLGEQCVLHVAGTADNEAALADTYTFHPILKKSRFRYADIGSFFHLQKLIRKEKIDTVIIEHPYMGWLGWMLKKSCEVKLVVHTHNVEYERFRSLGKSWWPLLKWYEGFVLRSADSVFCISEEDRQWMIEKLSLPISKCVLVPYGITQTKIPVDKLISKQQVASKHQLDPDALLLFFNGLLDYKPNTDAIRTIITKINPLLKQSDLNYNILIAGKRLPQDFGELKQWNNEHIFYAGFVDDIDLYTKAADILLNPVKSGGGVKTKMIEALGLNTSVIATDTGAIGVDKTVCGEKLKVVKDGDWNEFTNEIMKTSTIVTTTPESFYSRYNWKAVVQQSLQHL